MKKQEIKLLICLLIILVLPGITAAYPATSYPTNVDPTFNSITMKNSTGGQTLQLPANGIIKGDAISHKVTINDNAAAYAIYQNANESVNGPMYVNVKGLGGVTVRSCDQPNAMQANPFCETDTDFDGDPIKGDGGVKIETYSGNVDIRTITGGIDNKMPNALPTVYPVRFTDSDGLEVTGHMKAQGGIGTFVTSSMSNGAINKGMLLLGPPITSSPGKWDIKVPCPAGTTVVSCTYEVTGGDAFVSNLWPYSDGTGCNIYFRNYNLLNTASATATALCFNPNA